MPRKKPDTPPTSLVLATPGARFSPVGLTLAKGMGFDEWQSLGASLSRVERGINWWLGDWLNHGQARYGEKYASAINATGRELGTLTNLASVAGRIEPSRRRENLSWSHHAEVAYLDPEKRDRLLDEAEAHGWSVRALRDAVQGLTREITAPHPLSLPPADNPLNQAVAFQAKHIRTLAGLSQRQIATELYGSPTMQGYVSGMERGKFRPNLATLERFAEWAGVPIESFGVHGASMVPRSVARETIALALEALEEGNVKRVRVLLVYLDEILEEGAPVAGALEVGRGREPAYEPAS